MLVTFKDQFARFEQRLGFEAVTRKNRQGALYFFSLRQKNIFAI